MCVLILYDLKTCPTLLFSTELFVSFCWSKIQSSENWTVEIQFRTYDFDNFKQHSKIDWSIFFAFAFCFDFRSGGLWCVVQRVEVWLLLHIPKVKMCEKVCGTVADPGFPVGKGTNLAGELQLPTWQRFITFVCQNNRIETLGACWRCPLDLPR